VRIGAGGAGVEREAFVSLVSTVARDADRPSRISSKPLPTAVDPAILATNFSTVGALPPYSGLMKATSVPATTPSTTATGVAAVEADGANGSFGGASGAAPVVGTATRDSASALVRR